MQRVAVGLDDVEGLGGTGPQKQEHSFPQLVTHCTHQLVQFSSGSNTSKVQKNAYLLGHKHRINNVLMS